MRGDIDDDEEEDEEEKKSNRSQQGDELGSNFVVEDIYKQWGRLLLLLLVFL